MGVDLLRFPSDHLDDNARPTAHFQMAWQSWEFLLDLARSYGFRPGPTVLKGGWHEGVIWEPGWHSNDGALVSAADATGLATALRAALADRPRLDWDNATNNDWWWAEDYEPDAPPCPPNVTRDFDVGYAHWEGPCDPAGREELFDLVRFLEAGAFRIV